ncbi:unnamed protein product [Oikopleura dioica]|uniref:Uncharacterized protein n=1 Tax=Oikopleura dioica TaxID=34765 RepID=E4XP78_OIKDI|nr:unnamed protein product [Oikopleura dioica]
MFFRQILGPLLAAFFKYSEIVKDFHLYKDFKYTRFHFIRCKLCAITFIFRNLTICGAENTAGRHSQFDKANSSCIEPKLLTVE